MTKEVYLVIIILVSIFSIMLGMIMLLIVREDVAKEYKKSDFKKMRVAIVHDDFEIARKMLCKLEPQPFDMVVHKPGLVETRSLLVYLIKAGDYNFHGVRLNFVYTTKEIADSEWFKVIIRPMIVAGIGELCE